jgi:hypothetical protein
MPQVLALQGAQASWQQAAYVLRSAYGYKLL